MKNRTIEVFLPAVLLALACPFIARAADAPRDVLPEDPGWGGEERFTQVQFADWPPRHTGPHDENVEVYSNCVEVELFLNGKSLGAKPLNKDASPRTWRVAFAPGILRAVARNAKREIASDELRTAGPPAKLVLSASRATISPAWDEAAFVTATIVDENGNVVPRANDLITFHASDPGVIVAVDNADNLGVEPFQALARRAYQGRCEAAVKTTKPDGKLVVTASAPGLKAAGLEIASKSE